MNSDSSPQPPSPPTVENEPVDADGASILDFPVDEVSSPGAPAGTWADADDVTQDGSDAPAVLHGVSCLFFSQ